MVKTTKPKLGRRPTYGDRVYVAVYMERKARQALQRLAKQRGTTASDLLGAHAYALIGEPPPGRSGMPK